MSNIKICRNNHLQLGGFICRLCGQKVKCYEEEKQHGKKKESRS